MRGTLGGVPIGSRGLQMCVCVYSVCVCFPERGSVSTLRASALLWVKAPAELAAFTPFESFTATRRGRLSVTLIYYPECIA